MNASGWLTADEPAVEHALFVLSFRNLAVHGIGQFVLSAIVVAGAWSTAPHVVLVPWGMWMLFTSFMLWLGAWIYHRKLKALDSFRQTPPYWRWINMLLLSAVGIGWGTVGLLFVPQAHTHNLMLVTAFSGVLAYSALSNAPHDPKGFGVSAVLAILLLAPRLSSAYGDLTGFVLGMNLIYLIALVLAARNARVTLLAAIKLRLENEVLAHKNAENATRAEQANRDKSAFLAAASHDLRQPVHALLLLIEAYRQQVPTAVNHPLMQHIVVAGQSIGDLFNGLMDLSKLESGAEKPAAMTFDLSEVLQDVFDRTRLEAERKGLALRKFVSRALPTRLVCSDKLLLERIVSNLLSNAVRYTTEGGILLSLRRAHDSDGLWLEVWDTGLGIAELDRTRIFSPYVQVGNLERDRSKGLGLGLAIVHHAAKLLGLQLSLHSQPGRGSCFRLHLFASMLVPEKRITTRIIEVPPVDAHPLLAGHRILLVEDDPMVLLAMQAVLASWRMDVRCAQRGDASALEVCTAEWVPECVLCDFRLPGPLNGIELLDLVLDHYPEAVGLIQTGELAQSIHAQAEEAGYMVLFKPVDPHVLASTLNAVLSKRLVAESL